MDRLTSIEAFLAVVDTHSFTQAAARLRLSPAMISTHIARLEENVGARLFNRTTRRVDITEHGRQFLPHAREVMHAFASAENSFRAQAGLSGRVRLDAPASLGLAFVVPALKAFRQLHPNIIIDLSLGDRGTIFRADGFDILLRVGEAPVPGWVCEPLGSTRLVCVASPEYLASHDEPETPDDLNDHACILYASVEAPGGSPWLFSEAGKNVKVRPPVALTFNEGAAITRAAVDGLGPCQNLEMLIGEEVAQGTLVPILENYSGAPMPVVLMSANDRYALPYVRVVMDYLQNAIDWKLD